MRELKFRAWDLNKKKMHRDVNINTSHHSYPINFSSEGVTVSSKYTSAFAVMQFTGLKDKSGKEIYESDIVRFKHGEQGKDEFNEKTETVSFLHGSFCLGSTSLGGWYNDKDGNISERLSHFQQTINRIDFYYRDFDLEIIGNIFENKELLIEEKTDAKKEIRETAKAS